MFLNGFFGWDGYPGRATPDQAMLDGRGHGLRPRIDSELDQDTLHPVLYGLAENPADGGNF
jgi:hypothetical protein